MMHTSFDSTPPAETLTVRTMIQQFLGANGFDGLYHPASCACKKDSLIPCGEVSPLCRAGYFRQPGASDEPDSDFYIGPRRDGE